MRKNEFNSIEDFTSQYIGEWNPSENHWFGLDFSFQGKEYRFCTGAMYKAENTILHDGREAVFGLYVKKSGAFENSQSYILLEEFATMEDALKSTCISQIPFEKVIMDDDTELLGQD